MAREDLPDVSIIVPTYNERDNIAMLVSRLDAALAGIGWEVVFVDDDSPDGTSDITREIARRDRRVRRLRRLGRRGLASAVIEGALSASADWIVVMDGDLQHDETCLIQMLALLRAGHDLVVGSRHLAGGDNAGLGSSFRRMLSDAGTNLVRRTLPVRLSDPMSGFFAIRRSVFERLAPLLPGRGFKILLDLVLASPDRLQVAEVPFVFRPRIAGKSKLDVLVIAQFIGSLLDRALGGVLPLRFVSFAGVGLCGLAVHLAVLAAGRRSGLGFGAAQITATIIAILANFQLNNSVTYRDHRLRGRALVRGLAVFVLGCGLGSVANIGIARLLYEGHAGWTMAGLIGGMVGLVWNYAISTTLVWRLR